MRSRRVPGQIDAIRIAVEQYRVAVNPRDGATYLLCQRHQITLRVDDVVEVNAYEVRACVNIHLRHECAASRGAFAPLAAVYVHAYRGVRAARGIEVQTLNRRR